MIKTIETQCCIAGGGPAGLMLGLLLARGGVDVVVLEKHADFLRDFRGDYPGRTFTGWNSPASPGAPHPD